jgi:hypothetical protein
MTTWTKYTFACDPNECDTLIEVSCRDFGFPNGVTELTCPCGRKMNYLSYEDATIAPIKQTEEKMEDTTLSPAVGYNPDLLVTYKKINSITEPEFVTDKVRNIEWALEHSRSNAKIASSYATKVSAVKDIITEAYADSEDQELLQQIAETLDISLTRTVNWTATIEVSGEIEIDLLDNEDFEQTIYDSLYVDANQGDITIGDTEVCNVRESY